LISRCRKGACRSAAPTRSRARDVAGYRARDVNASGRIDGQIVRVNAAASAYGGWATASGTVKAGQPLALDLAGRASNLDLRNLPPALKAPGVPSNLQFTYQLHGRGPVFSGDVLMARSTLAGATIAPGTTGSFRIGGGAPAYAANGEVANLDVQQVGRGFGIAALAADKYRSTINATLTMTGSGGGRDPLTLDATGTVTDSQLFGASFPRLDFTTNIAAGDLRVKATGQFANLNPEVVTGNQRTRGELSGAIDADARIRGYANRCHRRPGRRDGTRQPCQLDLCGSCDRHRRDRRRVCRREGNLNQDRHHGPRSDRSGAGVRLPSTKRAPPTSRCTWKRRRSIASVSC
jgi:hypothetical protein